MRSATDAGEACTAHKHRQRDNTLAHHPRAGWARNSVVASYRSTLQTPA
jgi:hypothetical protein